MPFPYERLIQWIAGPLAAAIAYGATKLVHANISHNSALSVATFVATAAATYLAHHKWLDNVPKWWDQMSKILPVEAVDETQTVLEGKPETAAPPDPPAEAAQLPAGR